MTPQQIAEFVTACAEARHVEVSPSGTDDWQTHRDGVHSLCLLIGRGSIVRLAPVDSTPAPATSAANLGEEADFGLVARVLLIGEKDDGTPLLTQVEADGTEPLKIEFLIRKDENPVIGQQTFETQKELLNWLSSRLHYAQMNLTGKPTQRRLKTPEEQS